MDKIRRFFSLKAKDRWLLTKAYTSLVTINLLLGVFPYNKLRQLIACKCKGRLNFPNDPFTTRRIVEAIEIASRYTPRKYTCLVKALACYFLLTRTNIPVDLCIGVRLGLPGQLVTHAWIVNQGEVILGYIDDLPSYTKLTTPSMKVV